MENNEDKDEEEKIETFDFYLKELKVYQIDS